MAGHELEQKVKELLDRVERWKGVCKHPGLVLDTAGQNGNARMDLSDVVPVFIDYIHWQRRRADGTIEYEILMDPGRVKEVKESADAQELLFVMADGTNFRFTEYAV